MKLANIFRDAYKNCIKATINRIGKNDQQNTKMAMGAAVGGSFDEIGYLEKLLLIQHGLKPESDLIDVGCGSGRLLSQLEPEDVNSYMGTDISPELLEYSKQFLRSKKWTLKQVDGCHIPADDSCCDMVCMFSVITHLLHQESYLYFQEASRVLRQEGKLIVSFLEFRHPSLWPIFEASVDMVLSGERLDTFIDRDGLKQWAEHSGLEVIQILDGEKPHIPIDREIVFDNGTKISHMARLGPIGQSVAILLKK